jgi:hypothetical protein
MNMNRNFYDNDIFHNEDHAPQAEPEVPGPQEHNGRMWVLPALVGGMGLAGVGMIVAMCYGFSVLDAKRAEKIANYSPNYSVSGEPVNVMPVSLTQDTSVRESGLGVLIETGSGNPASYYMEGDPAKISEIGNLLQYEIDDGDQDKVMIELCKDSKLWQCKNPNQATFIRIGDKNYMP